MSTSRRTFLKLLSAGAMSASFPASISRALEIPASHRTGTINDVEHIVILMQENRSFDHLFGSLRGVRGFGDPRAVMLPSGKPVWYQPHEDGYLLPFHPGGASGPNLGLQFLEGTPHDWTSTQKSRNGGHYDQWVPNKGVMTMSHLVRSDIPYHYALADAFTICDAYHCSLLGPTDPNRFHMWTGWVGNDGQGGGPVVDNAEAGYTWTTYPERLQEAGVSWKIYQDVGHGLSAKLDWGETKDAYIGTYGDSSLLYFKQYQNADPEGALHAQAKTGTNIAAQGTLFDIFRKDVLSGTLPQVSWIVAPEAYSEHPNWPANFGAWYVSQILEALTANSEVWSKTAFFLTYDENDGLFDHIVPPVPPASRADGLSMVETTHDIFPGHERPGHEAYPAGPYGLGVRVAMTVISPWSKGGWVNSQLFDHTSMIRFIEARFGVHEPNITPWRRTVCGDLTSCFDFSAPSNAAVSLPKTIAYVPPDNKRYPDYKPAPPAKQAMPVQEPGTRPARPLPYELQVHGGVDAASSKFTLRFVNSGKAGAVFQVRSGQNGVSPRDYTVAAAGELSDTWDFEKTYDLSVYGPNGFLRAFRGSADHAVESTVQYDADGNSMQLHLHNRGTSDAHLHVRDMYAGTSISHTLGASEEWQHPWALKDTFGWYDFVIEVKRDQGFRQQLAGHLETGRDSTTDPAIGAAKA